MDSRFDLKSIAENKEYVLKLATALDTKNEIVKKKIVEILSALCSYSELGYKRSVEILEKYKEIKNERFRFKALVNELDKGSSLEYKVAILTLVNSILASSKLAEDRILIRGELIGLNILPVLNNLRAHGNTVPDLQVQLEQFDEQKEYDDLIIQGPDGINLNSHLAVFYALLHRVSNTQQEIRFLNILQHLLRIETKDVISDVMWSTAETLVHRSSLIESQDDANRLLRTPNFQKMACPHCRFDIASQRKLSLPQNETPAHQAPPAPTMTKSPPPPPPPPMMPPQIAISHQSSPSPVPPPPPIILQESQASSPSNRNMIAIDKRSKTPDISAQITKTLPQQETPTPRTKMKTINWNKIPPNKVIGTNNVWSRVAEFSPITGMNWDEMEGLFCQQVTQGSPKFDAPDNRRSRRDEITLLDGKKSLNVNIFLKQFRNTNNEITRMIHEGDHEIIGLERLRGLLKILPEFDEMEMLKNFDGDKMKLGNAEKFLLQLMQVPNYKLRIECMLLKEEFSANLSYLEPSINAMLYAGEDLMGNKALQEVLYMIVLMGNFLNAGGYAGNAAGVKLTSLQKLTDIRANKPGMNLIHFVALQAEKKDKSLLYFADRMNHLENASKMTIEQVNNEIVALDKRISNISRQINLPSTEDDIKIQMKEFLKMAEDEIKLLHGAMNELEKMRIRLSDFFCEDSAQFKIEECFKIFYHFCEKFKSAIKDNEKRRTLEEQAVLRRKQREEQLAQKRQQFNQYSNVPYESEPSNSFLMDPPTLSYDIRFSPAMNRRRMGSFNTNSSNQGYDYNRDEGMSPDITPNGSLRRRRSRVLSEEDEDNLMDFLRSSGHDNNSRERKSANGYGSLDRSWARRARTGNAKSRPDLLNVDFGPDRERPTSPSPTVERKVLQEQEEVKPRAISKEWRQKIENWLHANEQDGKSVDEYRRNMRRVPPTKRSLEHEKDGETTNKLDTLLEEKSSSQTLSPTGNQVSSEPYRRVYPEWKPLSTIEKIEDLETTETLPGMIYAQAKAVDKSSVRKSLLNSTESSSEGVCKRSVAKEEKKKSTPESSPTESSHKTSDDLNKQCIYISSKEENAVASPLNRKTSSVYICPDSELQVKAQEIIPEVLKHTRRLSVNLTNNKVEIDSDNIETPPTVRKSFSGSIKKTNVSNDNVPFGDGQFDRFSSARRTRRYKRPSDLGSSNNTGDEQSTIPLQPDASASNEVIEKDGNKSNVINDVVTRIGKIGKSISKISQEDVREAIRSLKSPTPEHEWKINQPLSIAPSVKITTHELNDEGFEETQSLVSDTPSLTTSSCNEDSKSKKLDNSEKGNINNTTNALKRKPIRPSNQLQTLLSRNQQSLERSRSLRNANLATPKNTSSFVQRTNSLRRPDDLQQKLSVKSVTNKRLDVERSNSRTSLRSSRSSLNSAVSTNTVKKMPQKVESKRPIVQQKDSLSLSKPSPRVPASRSSSSGSSIQSLRKPPISATKLPSPNSLPSVRSKISPPSSGSITKTDSVSSARANAATNSNFMRPTTATKARQKIIKPK